VPFKGIRVVNLNNLQSRSLSKELLKRSSVFTYDSYACHLDLMDAGINNARCRQRIQHNVNVKVDVTVIFLFSSSPLLEEHGCIT